jgi:hypothetical protein
MASHAEQNSAMVSGAENRAHAADSCFAWVSASE